MDEKLTESLRVRITGSTGTGDVRKDATLDLVLTNKEGLVGL